MSQDSEEDIDDIEYEEDDDQENEFVLDDENAGLLDDMSEEGEDDSADDNSDDDSDEDDSDDDDDIPPASSLTMGTSLLTPMEVDSIPPPQSLPSPSRKAERYSPPFRGRASLSQSQSPILPTTPLEPLHRRSPSPATLRKRALMVPIGFAAPQPRSYIVEAICALPHPVPTHALASSLCMTHLLTGSEDGYIRDYDIFPAVNGKNFLTAPQRAHASVVEGIMKAAQVRFWWENPGPVDMGKLAFAGGLPPDDDLPLAPVYSLAMQSDALWALAGTDAGHINLFTVRHEPGRLCYVLEGHRGHVSALALDHDEKSVFSAGWDGDARQWDLNTGQTVRHFTAHGAQVAALAVRPLSTGYAEVGPAIVSRTEDAEGDFPSTTQNSDGQVTQNVNPAIDQAHIPPPGDVIMSNISKTDLLSTSVGAPVQDDEEAKSDDSSFDPLFDDEDGDGESGNGTTGVRMESQPTTSVPPQPVTSTPQTQIGAKTPTPATVTKTLRPQTQQQPRMTLGTGIAPPKNAPPLLDPMGYTSYSPDLLMTACIDGQVILWDRRVHSPGRGVGRLWMSEKTPPWCLSACWSADGGQMYAGRRNGTIDVWDARQLGISGPLGTPRLLRTLRNPSSSGVVSCVAALPDCRHLACASFDNLRLWNVAEAAEFDMSFKSKGGVQFKIIPGHHGGYISQLLIDPGARFLVSASSNRGWHGESTRTVFVHDIKANF